MCAFQLPANTPKVMMNEFFRFARSQFQQAKNGLMQIILLNVLGFLSLLLLRTGLVLAGKQVAYTALLQSLVLPSSWTSYLQQPWTLLTYSWVPTSFFTMLWGLVVLYTLGQVVVNLAGNRHFMALYLLGSVCGGSFFLLLYYFSPPLQNSAVVLVGFSGSLYAIIVAAATLAPQLSFSFLLLGPIKLKYIASFLLLLSLVGLSDSEPADSIAQLGGALFGYFYVKQLYGYPRLRQYWRRLWGVKSKLKVSYRQSSTKVKDHQKTVADQSHLEHILDKVAESGYESLSKAEKQQLFEAGQ